MHENQRLASEWFYLVLPCKIFFYQTFLDNIKTAPRITEMPQSSLRVRTEQARQWLAFGVGYDLELK